MQLQGKSPDTIKSYIGWVAKYIDFIANSNYPTREDRIGAYLTHLIDKFNESASTQHQALCAIILFYKIVRKEEVGRLDFKRSSKPLFLPVILSRKECWSTLDHLSGESWLWDAFMWGCGLRLNELCSLRVMDIDLDRKQIHVHQGKGAKDRILPLPDLLIEPVGKWLRVLRDKFDANLMLPEPVRTWLPGALAKKYPMADLAWGWYWLFPASGPMQNKSKDTSLHVDVPTIFHVHKSAVQKRMHRAFNSAGIVKKATCHTLRHSFATHWLENAEGSHEIAIIRLQKLMGHADPETTMIYLHCVKQRTDVLSPIDVPLMKLAA